MKTVWICVCLLFTSFSTIERTGKIKISSGQPVQNIFVITIDGFRWQELFTGADSLLINNSICTADTAFTKALYWASTQKERREKLLPFFWNVIAKKGQLYGNRYLNNKVNVANVYKFSYPGYNEIVTGTAGLRVNSNDKKNNPNINILEYLNNQPEFAEKVVAFTSWDVFPFILNKDRNNLFVNSGYQQIKEATTEEAYVINEIQDKHIYQKGGTRYDQLTFITAKEYIQKHKPRVMLLGLGETDDHAHAGRYDLYLQQANAIDRMIGELWNYIQTTPGYKNNTSILITTDHGRGSRPDKWREHGSFIKGSAQTWLALLGPNVPPLGEVKEKQQIYQKQYAQTIAKLVGENFKP